MPYIRREKRSQLDPVVDDLLNALRELQCDDPSDSLEGNLNYIFSTVLGRLYASDYRDINTAMGVLACVQAEYYRKQAAPYEDQKEFENGAVYGLRDWGMSTTPELVITDEQE